MRTALIFGAYTQDKNDSYVGIFLGWESEKNNIIVPKLEALEKKYVERYGLSKEFKSTVINKKNFICGIRSFNKDSYDFYSDYFQALQEVEPIIHVNVLSKVEILIRNVFGKSLLQQFPFLNPSSFYYSMTKFFIFYHSPKLIQMLYKSAEIDERSLFMDELASHLKTVIYALEGIERKKREVPVLEKLLLIVSYYEPKEIIRDKYDFVYAQNFVGLLKLLNERNISYKDVTITIDREEKTFDEATKFEFKEIMQSDSEDSIQIRMTDHLCGFVGRMMYALVNDRQLKEDAVSDIDHLQENDLVRKHILGSEWFALQEKHFDLYLQVYRVLIIQQEAYWAVMTWSYADQVSMFYTLLRYIASYKTFENFQKRTPEEHSEYYNTACCLELERHFTTW